MKDIKEAFKIVFTRPKYILISSIIALFIFFFFLFLNNVPLFVQIIKLGDLSLIPVTYSSIVTTIVLKSGYLALSLMILVSVLSGIDLSMIIFKFKEMNPGGNPKELGTIGASAIAAFGAGCPACATSLLSLLGVAGGLAILPFKGVEITSLSAILLTISLLYISRGINAKTCKVR